MTLRRRGDDNARLYDFAKKYQENQNSSELVKKQNATEEKVLSARLAYLNNQKELIKKTMEKEIDLVRRNSLSRASYQMDRSASLPSAVASTRENLAELKRERCLLLVTPQSPSIVNRNTNNAPSKEISRYCNGIYSMEQASKQRGNVEVEPSKNEKQTDSCFQETTCVTTGKSTRVGFQINRSSSTKRHERNVSLKTVTSSSKVCCGDSTPRCQLTNDEAENVERNDSLQMKQDRCHTSFYYSQALQARRQAWMRMPAPFPKLEREGRLTNETLVQTSRLATGGRNNQLRFSRTMSSHLSRTVTPRKTNSYNAIGVPSKDLRFKKLESLLVPINHSYMA